MNKFRTAAVTAAAVVGVAAGGYGIAAATGSQTAPIEAEADDVQEPQLDGSIQVDEVEGESEADESARLAESATIDEATAAAAALATHPGEITETELGNENGSVVWEFDITQEDGTTVDVKVDAGNGSVLAADTDDDEEESDEADDDDVQHENEHDGDNDPDEDHED